MEKTKKKKSKESTVSCRLSKALPESNTPERLRGLKRVGRAEAPTPVMSLHLPGVFLAWFPALALHPVSAHKMVKAFLDERQKSWGEGREKQEQNETRQGWFSLGVLFSGGEVKMKLAGVLIFLKAAPNDRPRTGF